jgi:hypothetical protein
VASAAGKTCWTLPLLVLPLTRTICLVQLTEFMQEMDGLQSQSEDRDKGVVVVGATNRVSFHLR